MKKETKVLCEAAAKYFAGSYATLFIVDKLTKKLIKNWLLRSLVASAIGVYTTFGWLIAVAGWIDRKLPSEAKSENAEEDSETA